MIDSCAKVLAGFPDLVEGGVSPELPSPVSRHLGACASCRRRIQDQKQMVAALEEMPQVSVPGDFRSSVMAQVMKAPLPILVQPRRSHLKLIHLLVWTLAAAGSASLGAGIRILSQGHWDFPALFDPALLIEQMGGLGRIALAFMIEAIGRAQLPSLLPNLHIPYASTVLAVLITTMIGLGLAAGVLGLGVLATARSFFRIRRH